MPTFSAEVIAEYGCEHLAKAILDGRLSKESIADLWKNTISRAHRRDLGKATSTLMKKGQPVISQQYHCIECQEHGADKDMNRHAKKASHVFALEGRSESLYCSECKDLIYDVFLDALAEETSLHATRGRKRKASEISGDESYLTGNSTQRPCGKEGCRGLFNLGETCYMNAIVQMMLHNQILSSYFLSNAHPVHTCSEAAAPAMKEGSDDDDDEDAVAVKAEYQPCVTCSVSRVFAESRLSEKAEPMDAVNLLFASWKMIPHMAGKSQQDAQEYYMMLVDKLHESTAAVSDWKGRCQCFFHKAFFGRMRSEVTCDGCGTISRTQDAFSVISLDFQKQAKRRKKFAALQSISAVPDLYGALQAYTSAETLLAEDYTCQGCVTPNSASKRLRIRKLPALLCIQVKRFGARTSGGSYVEEKHEGRIDFPLMLNMRPFTARVKGQEEERLEYDLESVVVHVGQQIQNGHYLAFCRQDDTWFRFDDEMVSKSTAAEVLAQEAYLLFYSLRSWTPAGIRPPQNGVR